MAQQWGRKCISAMLLLVIGMVLVSQSIAQAVNVKADSCQAAINHSLVVMKSLKTANAHAAFSVRSLAFKVPENYLQEAIDAQKVGDYDQCIQKADKVVEYLHSSEGFIQWQQHLNP